MSTSPPTATSTPTTTTNTPTTTLSSSPSSSPINCCVLGYGMSGKSFHSYLISLESPALRLYGIMARSPSTLQKIQADYPLVKIFNNIQDVCADINIHLVVIATPPSTHVEFAKQLLLAGKHLVIDKPITIRYTDFLEIERLHLQAQQSLNKQIHVFCFHNRRLDSDYMTVKHLIQQDIIGSVKWMEMGYNKGISSKEWKLQPTVEGGGRFWDLGSHCVDQFQSLYPNIPIRSVYCRMIYNLPIASDVDSFVQLTIVLEDETTCVIDCNSIASVEKPRFLLIGETGTYIKFGQDPQEAAMMEGHIETGVEDVSMYGKIKWRRIEYKTAEAAKHNEIKGNREEVVETLRGDWRVFYKNVNDVLRDSTGRTKPLVTLDQCKRTYAIMQAALLSHQKQQVIHFNNGQLPIM